MPALIPLIDRIQVDEQTGCWNWKGAADSHGYGRTCYRGRKNVAAHRLSAHLWLGISLDDPRCVLHKCDNPRCIKPKHLFLGTQLDNLRDMTAKGRHHNQVKKFCKYGHPFDEANTYHHPSKLMRVCIICNRMSKVKVGVSQ